ncbi:MAG: Holliday junction branch migration protein RuvA [Planctomycetes bacterium]|nr:Holliday junction branch migration protein RuvA [Planctomycetota bacterium]
MYEYLSGRLVERAPDEVVLDVQGVGFLLHVSGATAGRLPERGAELTLFVHWATRDERPILFGFASREERTLFERLLSVSKVGPSIALALLSALEPARLAAAVDAGDVALLAKVKGVGKRTAERLCVELKGRLESSAVILPGAVTDRASAVASALCALGYPRPTARDVATRVCSGAPAGASLEELVKRALSEFGRSQAGSDPPG